MTTMTMDEKFRALNNKTRRMDKFLVEYVGLPENISNILGRQTKNIQRPAVNFQAFETNFRGTPYAEKGQISFDPIRITFWDDENGLVSNILFVQILRQMNRFRDVNGVFEDTDARNRDFRFGIKIKMLNSRDEVTEEYMLINCFLTGVEHDQPEITDDSDSTISVGVSFDNVGLVVFDEYIEFLEKRRYPNNAVTP